MGTASSWYETLKPFFGKGCAIVSRQGRPTISALIFDGDKEKKAAAIWLANSTTKGTFERTGKKADEFFLFGIMQEGAKYGGGVKGVLRSPRQIEGLLLCDRQAGAVLEVHEGSPRERKETVGELDIRLQEPSKKIRSVKEHVQELHNEVAVLLQEGDDAKTRERVVTRISKGLADIALSDVRAAGGLTVDFFGWMLMTNGELLQKLGRKDEARLALEAAVAAGYAKAKGPLGKL